MPVPSPTAARFQLQQGGDTSTFAECGEMCEALGEQLPCIVNSHDNAALNEITASGGGAWLGYSEHEGAWRWEYGCESGFATWSGTAPSEMSSGATPAAARYEAIDEAV